MIRTNETLKRVLLVKPGGVWYLNFMVIFVVFVAIYANLDTPIVESFNPYKPAFINPHFQNPDSNSFDNKEYQSPFAPTSRGSEKSKQATRNYFRPRASRIDPNIYRAQKNSMRLTVRFAQEDNSFEHLYENRFLSQFGDADNIWNLEGVINEAKRRCLLANPDYLFNREQFLELAVEDNKLTINGLGEAMALMQAEAQMVLTNPTRGINKGLDSICTVKEPFSTCTHVEVTRPVGSKILFNQRFNNPKLNQDVYKEAYALGKKKFLQAKKWSLKYAAEHRAVSNSTDFTKLPLNPNNVLILVDLFDVPPEEKHLVKDAFRAGVEDKAQSSLPSQAPIKDQPLIQFIN